MVILINSPVPVERVLHPVAALLVVVVPVGGAVPSRCGPVVPRGVTHGDELIYLFSPDIWVFNDQDWDISWNMINLWANFATYGNPINSDHPLTDIPQWPKWTEDNLQYLKIDVESSVRRDYVRTWSDPDADTR